MSAVAQEFNISVTPLGAQDQYLVRTEWVAPGVPLAEEQVRWPVEEWLGQAKQLMNDPLLGLLQGGNALGTSSSRDLVAFGQELYEALFQKSLLNSWERAQGIAENRQMVLRLRLGLKGTRLPRLPWEVLHAGDRPLATGTDVAFSRYDLTTGLRSQTPTLITTPNQPLKILMVIAGPSDQETLALKQEARHLQEELSRRSYNGYGQLQLEILEQPGREQLTQALEQGDYQVFHYAGHSNLGVAGGALYLVSNKTGLTETLSGDDLAGLLVNNGVQMAVFNSCRGAYTASEAALENGREQNLVQALVKRRIPAVLAMAERIPDEVALTLTRLFYRNLNQGYPIDLSLSRARQGLISAYGSNQLYWALPVLYLNPKFDGFLTGSPDPEELQKLLALPDPDERWTDDDDNDDLALDDFALGEEDLDYEDDAAVVSELFGQLPKADYPTEQPLVQTSGQQTLLPDTAKAQTQNYPFVPAAGGGQPTANSQQPRTVQTTVQKGSHTTQNWASKIQEPKSQKTPQSKLRVAGEGSVQPSKGWRLGFKKVPVRWLLGATGVLAIALGGWWFLQNRGPQPPDLIPSIPAESVPNPPEGDLKKANTASVTALAIEQFSKGNLLAGAQAVEELLKPERNALNQAEASLEAVPQQQKDNAEINFLRGRVAWQSAQQSGNKKYSIDDARRYWEFAVKQQPNDKYLTALGFAYYALGNFDAADTAWFDALNQSSKNQPATAGSVPSKQALTMYAGLALGYTKSAQSLPPDKRAKLLNAAIQYREKVMRADPVNFQPDALSKNWLWTEKAIQDWRTLLQQQASGASPAPVRSSGANKNVVTPKQSPSKNGRVRGTTN